MEHEGKTQECSIYTVLSQDATAYYECSNSFARPLTVTGVIDSNITSSRHNFIYSGKERMTENETWRVQRRTEEKKQKNY